MSVIKNISAIIILTVFSLLSFSCREQKKEVIVNESDDKRAIQRATEKVEDKVNEEKNEEIENISDDN